MIVRYKEYALRGTYICAQCGEKIKIFNDGTKMPRCTKCKATTFLLLDTVNDKGSFPDIEPKP